MAPGADGEFTLIEDDDTDVARTTLSWDQAAGTLTIGAADDPQGVLPAERAWTVTVLGVEHEPLAASGPTGEPLRAGGRRRPAPAHAATARTRCSRPQRRAVRARGQGDRLADAELGPLAGAMLAELHAQGLPRELIGALSELLTAGAPAGGARRRRAGGLGGGRTRARWRAVLTTRVSVATSYSPS